MIKLLVVGQILLVLSLIGVPLVLMLVELMNRLFKDT